MNTYNDLEEHVFVCLLLNWKNYDVVPFYVSKEYNLNLAGEPFKSGRFVFARFLPGVQNSFNYIILAEEPVNAYTGPDFNVELHYLEKKKYYDLGNYSRRPLDWNETRMYHSLITYCILTYFCP